ncbi:MAG: transcriptional repressor LexA [Victivallales bacterium]|nr:transcriptional repressor LexA [Victivallales bacterium]
MKGLTEKQRKLLVFIDEFTEREGIAPSVYDMADFCGVKTSTIFAHLRLLQNKGFITRSSKARSVALSKKVKLNRDNHGHIVRIPLLGRISAGFPGDSPEHQEKAISYDTSFLSGTIDNLFALKVTGESMRDMGIFDGDVVIVRQTHAIRQGDIVVALVDNETTVKTYFAAPDSRVELRPANPEYKSQFFPADRVSIQGKVVSLQRQY